MSERTPAKSENSRERWVPLGLGFLILALGIAIWEVFPPGLWHDDGVYVLLGRSLAQGDGLRYVGVVGDPLAPKFPPLFSLLLAGVWGLAPAFPDNLPLLAGVNLVLLAVSGGLFVAYLRKVLKLPLTLAFGITLLAWLSPHLWRFAMVPLSEPLFLLTLVLALWAGGHMEEKPGRVRPLVLFVLAGGMAVMARTLGVAVLAAGAGALFIRGRRREGGWALAGSAAVLLPWILWSGWASASIPGPLQDTLGPYGGWWLRQIVQEPGAAGAFVLGNVATLGGRILSLLLPGVTGGWVWLGVLLLPPLFLGLREASRKSWTLPLSLALCLGILLVWPFQDIRLVVPLHPLLVLGTVLGFRVLLTSVSSSGRMRPVVLGVVGGWVVLVAGVSGFRLGTGWPGEPYRLRSEALVEAVRAVVDNTQPDAVVGAPEFWSGIHLFTGRRVAPSAPFFPLAQEGPTWGTPAEQYHLWMEAGLTHILVEHGGRVHGEALDLLDALCPGEGVRLLVNRPGQFLVELAWDEACRERVLLAAESREGSRP